MYLKKTSLAVFSAICLLFTISSCDDDSSQFGLDVLPGDDKLVVKYSDTMSIPKKQVYDSLERLRLDDIVYLGYFRDPLLGEIKASLFSDFMRISSPIKLDSLGFSSFVSFTFHFNADSVYSGTSTSRVIFDIFEMKDSLQWDSSYNYTFQPNDYYLKDSMPLGSFEINVDSIKSGEVVTNLSASLAERIFKLKIEQIINFENAFKGLCIVPRSYTETGLMLTSDLNYKSTTVPGIYMKLNFKYNDTVGVDTTYLISMYFGLSSFVPNGNSRIYKYPKANIIEYNHAAASVNSYLKTKIEDTVLYAMNLGGAKVQLDMSGLNNFESKERIAVAKAELWIPYESGAYSSNYTNKADLKLFITYPNLADNYYDYAAIYSKVGKISELDTVNKVYKLDVTNYVQSYLSGKTKADKLLVSTSHNISLYHAILSRNKKATLKIKYSIF